MAPFADNPVRRLGRGMALLALPIILRLAWVMVLHPERYDNPTGVSYHRNYRLLAQKGDLLDRAGRPLARSTEAASIAANPQLITDPAAVAQRLAPLLQVPAEQLETRLNNRWRRVLLRRGLSEALQQRLQPLADAGILALQAQAAPTTYRLYVFPRQFQPTPAERRELAVILGVKAEELDGLLASEAGAIRFQEDLEETTATRLSALNLPGLVVQANEGHQEMAAWLLPSPEVLETVSEPSFIVGDDEPAGRVRIRPEVWQALQPVFEGATPPDPDEVARRMRTSFVFLAREMPLEVGDAVRELLSSQPGFAGVTVDHEWAREYPQGEVARLLIGKADADERGHSGLEELCNQLLTGVDGYRRVTVSAQRKPIVQEREERVDPAHGKTVELTVDVVVQDYCEQALRTAVDENDADWGLAVVVDPETGEIYAMADAVSKQRPQPTMLRGIATAYEPGSVIKPLVVAAALEAGLTTPNETFYCSGKTKIGRWTLSCIKTHGVETVSDAVRDSCNMVMIKLAERLQQARLESAFNAYGLLGRTGLALASQEASGAIFERSGTSWSPQKVATVSYGKGIQVTAVGLVRAYSALLNGGYLPQLHLVRRILDREGNLLVDQPLEPGPRLISDQTAEAVRKMLRRTVEEKAGTGHYARSERYDISGKTGTSLGYRPGEGRIVSFIGYAPADKPRLLCLVSVSGPRQGLGQGSTTCGPAVREILEQSLQYLGVAPHQTAAKEAQP